MSEADRHETITPSALNGLGAGTRNRVIRSRKRNLIDHDKPTRIPNNINPLPQGHGSHQTRIAFLTETPNQLCERLLPLEVDRQLGTLAQRLRPRLSTPARGEERQDPAPRGLGELNEFVQ